MILGFIGTGKISSSIILGIFKSKLKFKKIYISSRNRNIAKKLANKFGKVKIKISKEYKLADAKQAHKDLESRQLTGPAVIIP